MAYFDTKTLIAHPDVLQTSLLLPLKVVRLSLPSLPRAAPEGELAGGGGGGDPLVPVSPEPAVNIDGLELSRVTAFVEKITLPSTGPHGGDVIWRTKHSQSSVVHSHWSRNVEARLSLVETFIVLLRQLSYAIKNQLGHPKPPTRGFGLGLCLLLAGSLWHKG